MSSSRCNCKPHHEFPHRCIYNWEIKLGYGVAVSLAVFEAKRFILIVFELMANWHVIRLAGGFKPVILSFLNIFLGFPCALGAVNVIQRRKCEPRYSSKINKCLKLLLILIIISVILNMMTILFVCLDVSVMKKTVARAFNDSMHFYKINPSYKQTVDKIQFIFQCCGHSSYSDWFHLNWQQVVNYVPTTTERLINSIIDRTVPFSCCNIQAVPPCLHTHITNKFIGKIYVKGCAGVISNILIRIVVFTYAMGIFLILAQAFLLFCIVKILKKSVTPYLRLHCQVSQNNSEEFTSKSCKKMKKKRKVQKKCLQSCLKNSKQHRDLNGPCACSRVSSQTELSSDDSSAVARIKPSVHMQHHVQTTKRW